MSFIIYIFFSSIHGRDFIEVFPAYGKVPCRVGFFLMKRQPSCHNLKLLVRERTSKQLSVNRHSRFIFTIVDVDMRLVMLPDIPEQHIK